MPPPPVNPNAVLLNIPYDVEFQKLYLAYIVGLSQLGFDPCIASGIPGGERRLDRILTLAGAGTRNLHAASVFRELCLVSLDAVRRTQKEANG